MRRHSLVRAAATLSATLLLAGCGLGIGGLGRLGGVDTGPFAHKPGKISALIAPVPDAGGIIVREIDGAPTPVAERLRKAMIAALADQEIPAAMSGGNLRSRFLRGAAIAVPHGPGAIRLTIAWALTDRRGNPAGHYTVTQDVPRLAWERADPAALKAVAGPSAAAIAALIQGPAIVDQENRAHSLPLNVRPVVGVPQIDAIALRRAMEHALRERDYDVRPQLVDNALVIAGNVLLGKAEAGRQPIRISWAVLDSSGKELGRLSQNNTLAVGAGRPDLSGLAVDIAEAAADGVADVLDNLPPRLLAPGGSKTAPANAPKAPRAN